MGTQAQPAAEKPSPCIARQPILAGDESVIGYELLLRDNPDERRATADADSGTRAAINALNLIGLGVLCDGRSAFLKCTHQMLLMGYFTLLPPQEVVIELQNRVPVDEQVRSACQKLKLAGFRIALDNFEPLDSRAALVEYADYLKIDVGKFSAAQCETLVKTHRNPHCQMLAYRVE